MRSDCSGHVQVGDSDLPTGVVAAPDACVVHGAVAKSTLGDHCHTRDEHTRRDVIVGARTHLEAGQIVLLVAVRLQIVLFAAAATRGISACQVVVEKTVERLDIVGDLRRGEAVSSASISA